jgi:hypothetical protein
LQHAAAVHVTLPVLCVHVCVSMRGRGGPGGVCCSPGQGDRGLYRAPGWGLYAAACLVSRRSLSRGASPFPDVAVRSPSLHPHSRPANRPGGSIPPPCPLFLRHTQSKLSPANRPLPSPAPSVCRWQSQAWLRPFQKETASTPSPPPPVLLLSWLQTTAGSRSSACGSCSAHAPPSLCIVVAAWRQAPGDSYMALRRVPTLTPPPPPFGFSSSQLAPDDSWLSILGMWLLLSSCSPIPLYSCCSLAPGDSYLPLRPVPTLTPAPIRFFFFAARPG